MAHLKDTQYKDSSNFNARILLHYKFGTNKYSWPRWVFDQFRKEDNLKVLELGCGNGLLWALNADRVPGTWEITLSDFSDGMLKDAEKTIRNSVKQITYAVVNIENIPYENHAYDMILANHMLYHVPDRKKALSEIRRVLKKDGIFYATTLGSDYMREMRMLIREYKTGSTGTATTNSVIDNFSLQNGEEQLKEYFNEVIIKIYENSLIINEAGPFVDYMYSCMGMTQNRPVLEESDRKPLLEFVEEKLKMNGSIIIPSDSGIFISRNI
jgi:ubiquinone/menaquinone biosynthesis C-methylase UbiE